MKKVFISSLAILALAVVFMVSCKKDSTAAPASPVASFTSSATNLQVTFTNTSTNSTSYSWNFGDGTAASTTISPVHTYATPGTYSVTLTANGTDSVTHSIITVGPNLLVGGDFSDTTQWHRYAIYPGVHVNYVGNSVVWTGGDSTGVPTAGQDGHYGIYQAVSVTAGKTYQIDMHVQGDSLYQVWFEVYVSDTIPDPATANGGNDYNYGGKRLALNAWDCGNASNVFSPFNGQLSAVTCEHDSNTGGIGYYGSAWNKISFTSAMLGGTTGTVYIMIRAGGENFSLSPHYTGITVSNVTFNALN